MRLSGMLGIIAAAFVAPAAPIAAHPMPDTQIEVIRSAREISFTVRLPLADLLLALPSGPRDPRLLIGGNQARLRAYFAAHMRLFTDAGMRVPLAIGTMRLHRDHGTDVGDYAELEVPAAAGIGSGLPVWLRYDAVLHRIANHRAHVRSRNGRTIGVIRYSLSTRRIAPLLLPAG